MEVATGDLTALEEQLLVTPQAWPRAQTANCFGESPYVRGNTIVLGLQFSSSLLF